EHLEQLVRLEGLMPIDVSGMVSGLIEALGGVAVEDRSAEGDVLGAVAVATDCQVPAGHDKFPLAGARFTEDRDRLAFAVSAGVVLQLFPQACVEFRVVQAEEDRLDQVPLISRE